MKKLMKKLKSRKGFTLMEMLIVVAIIAILVAVAIPTFTSSLDKAKSATDSANLRAAKAVATTEYLLVQSGETSNISDGMIFDPDLGKFVDKTTKTDKMEGKSDGNSSKYIVVTVASDGYTVKWDSVT